MTIYHQGKVGRIYLGAQFCIWDHVWSRIRGHCSSIYNNKRINIVVRATMAYLHNIGDKGLLGCLPSRLTRNMRKYDAYEVVVAISPSMLDISPNSQNNGDAWNIEPSPWSNIPIETATWQQVVEQGPTKGELGYKDCRHEPKVGHIGPMWQNIRHGSLVSPPSMTMTSGKRQLRWGNPSHSKVATT